MIKMYNFPPPYSNFYKKSIRKSSFQKDDPKNNKTLKDDSEPSIDCIFILYKDDNKDSGLIICLLLLLLN